MWTPKRIFLLGLGFTLFLTTYIVYAFFLGGIDGLPPLPEVLGPSPDGDTRIVINPGMESEADRKLRQAFGPECAQVQKAIRLDIRKKGIVLSTDNLKIEDDGRVKLTPFSVALFQKEQPDAKFPEINTVESDVAYLTFDQPIKNLTEISTRKIIGGELIGHIHIVNNRRSAQKYDDIEIHVDAPMFYEEAQSKIWSDGTVHLLDKMTRPHPTVITGKGMDLLLTKENGPNKAKGDKAADKPRTGAVSNVDFVILRSWVEMHLYPDSGNGFLGGTKDGPPAKQVTAANGGKDKTPQPAATPTPKQQEKSHVLIRTPGKFIFDVVKDVATFENAEGSKLTDDVHVIREPLLISDDTGRHYDQLHCDFLRLQFRARADMPPAKTARDTGSTDREIESAHAISWPKRPVGQQVVLALDSENLDAHCAELFYESPTATRGPRTRLVGEQVKAVKDGHIIVAKELILVGNNQKGEGQTMTAQGNVQVDLFDQNSVKNIDPANPKKSHPIHALCKDTLVATKDKQGDQLYDLFILTTDASFIDEEHDQQLHGQRLKLWLEPADKGTPANDAGQKQSAPGAARQRPYKVEAYEQVRAKSPELIVHQCRILTIMFEEGLVPLPTELPAPANVATTPGLPTAPFQQLPPVPGAPVIQAPAPVVVGSSPKTEADKAEPKKPMQMRARDITTYVTRVGQKNELREMVAEGWVHVWQEGKEAKDKDGKIVRDKDGKIVTDKGIDITGEILTLNRHNGGDVLKVFGEREKYAILHLNDLDLGGPKVEIDQVKNTAYVDGPGFMGLPSGTTIDGGKPAQPGARLKVHWTKDMLFNGKDADFTGGVVASQDNSSMRCNTLEVQLDKFVSFKEGQKGGQGSKVEKMVSNGKVYVVDEVKNDKNEVVRTQRIVTPQVAVDNMEGHTHAQGPGYVKAVQVGSADDTQDRKPGTTTAQKTDEEEWNLTHVNFRDWMHTNNTNSTATATPGTKTAQQRVTTFYGSVEVFHVPLKKEERVEAIDWQLDATRLPKGAMYIKSDKLKVWTLPMADGTNEQEMLAETNVFFRTQDFYGRADTVKYNDKKQIVIFLGQGGNSATLYQVTQPGVRPKEIKGKTILYNRKTGQFSIEGGTSINWSRLDAKTPAESLAAGLESSSDVPLDFSKSSGWVCHCLAAPGDPRPVRATGQNSVAAGFSLRKSHAG